MSIDLDLAVERTTPSLNAALSCISIDLFGLLRYNPVQTTWRVVAFLAPQSIGRRSRRRTLSGVSGLSSTQDYPVVPDGLRVAVFVLNDR